MSIDAVHDRLHERDGFRYPQSRKWRARDRTMTPMMARITCLSIDDAVAVATKLEAVGYTVEITDEVDPYSLAVFFRSALRIRQRGTGFGSRQQHYRS